LVGRLITLRMTEADILDGWRNSVGMSTLPLPDRLALFLDVDGTLLDIAPTPDGVIVPATLIDNLTRLQDRLGGAMALVSGRSLDYLRGLFPGLSCAMAGLHGSEIDRGDGTDAPVLNPAWLDAAKTELAVAARDWPGVIVEDKGQAFAAHFRLAPGLAAAVEAEMANLADRLGDGVIIQRGKSVIEIRPAGSDKGVALETIMDLPAFRGRTPLAIGDDLTDEAMFSSAQKLGGFSAKVGPGDSVASIRIQSPAAVRAWIKSLIQ
jgi:trehalose 6-phosphate phosphatase